MARPLRIEFPGALYHVMSRGNERRAIMRDDVDRQKRIQWLRRTVETCGWRLHAFVLMSNHDHLLVETPQANLAAGMHLLNGSYTSYFNRRHRRAGHLLQGRYKGHLIEQEGYYLELSRYIHLNPVRAKLVERPEQWRWGSCPGYVWGSRALEWITYDGVLGEFGRSKSSARAAYRRFLQAGVQQPPESPFAHAVGGLILGSDAFVTRIRQMLDEKPDDADVPQLQRLRERPSLDRILAVVAEHFVGDTESWAPGRRSDDAGRAVAAYLARRCFGYSASATAAALGYRDHSGVGRAIRRMEQGTGKLQQTLRTLEKELLGP